MLMAFLLPPLRFTAFVKPTTLLSLLPFSMKQISESSSIFALFSDRNFLGMDKKFAISLGWMSRSSGIFPSLNVSLPLFLATTLRISDTQVAKPSTPSSEVWHSSCCSPDSPCRLDNSLLYRRLWHFLATSSFAAFVKPPYPLFLLFIGERSLKSSSLKFPSFLVSQLSPQG